MALTKDLGQFVADLSPNHLPEEAVRVARMGFIDTIGTMIVGRKEDSVRILTDALAPGDGSATLTFGARKAPAAQRAPICAALDLGTNNCRLLIAAERPNGELRIVDSFSRIVRLGEGLSRTGELSPAAIDRTVAALRICADRIRKSGASRVRAIATHASRNASNSQVLVERVAAETGLALEHGVAVEIAIGEPGSREQARHIVVGRGAVAIRIAAAGEAMVADLQPRAAPRRQGIGAARLAEVDQHRSCPPGGSKLGRRSEEHHGLS